MTESNDDLEERIEVLEQQMAGLRRRLFPEEYAREQWEKRCKESLMDISRSALAEKACSDCKMTVMITQAKSCPSCQQYFCQKYCLFDHDKDACALEDKERRERMAEQSAIQQAMRYKKKATKTALPS